METIPRGPGPQTYTGQGQVLPQGQGQGQVIAPAGLSSYGQPAAHRGQFRGAGDSIMVGRGMLADLRQLMQKVANATQQTAVAVQSQNPIPNPYVRELQDKQAQYLELLNKPNKTALDQFYQTLRFENQRAHREGADRTGCTKISDLEGAHTQRRGRGGPGGPCTELHS